MLSIFHNEIKSWQDRRCKMQDRKCNLLPLTLRTSQIQDLSEGTQNREQFYYRKIAFFVEKISTKTSFWKSWWGRIDERASNYITDAAKSSGNFYVKGLADQDLIAREAHYRTSSYKIFTKSQKVPSHNDTYKEAEQLAFKEVLKICHELNLKPKITYFTELVRVMRDTMLSKNVIMGEWTLKFLERKSEKHCTDIKIFNYQRKVVVYPVSLGIKQAIEQIIQLKEENEILKIRVFEDSPIMTLCGKFIKQEVSSYKILSHGHHNLKIFTQKNSKSQSRWICSSLCWVVTEKVVLIVNLDSNTPSPRTWFIQ